MRTVGPVCRTGPGVANRASITKPYPPRKAIRYGKPLGKVRLGKPDLLSRRSGIDKAALSRLENGQNANPTMKTLEVIARSIGVRIRLAVEEVGKVDART